MVAVVAVDAAAPGTIIVVVNAEVGMMQSPLHHHHHHHGMKGGTQWGSSKVYIVYESGSVTVIMDAWPVHWYPDVGGIGMFTPLGTVSVMITDGFQLCTI